MTFTTAGLLLAAALAGSVSSFAQALRPETRPQAASQAACSTDPNGLYPSFSTLTLNAAPPISRVIYPVTLSSSNTNRVSFAITSSTNWLTVSPSNGDLYGIPANLKITGSTEGLAAGQQFTGYVTIT